MVKSLSATGKSTGLDTLRIGASIAAVEIPRVLPVRTALCETITGQSGRKSVGYRYWDLGSFLASHEREVAIPDRDVGPFPLPTSRRQRARLLKWILVFLLFLVGERSRDEISSVGATGYRPRRHERLVHRCSVRPSAVRRCSAATRSRRIGRRGGRHRRSRGRERDSWFGRHKRQTSAGRPVSCR